MKKTVVLILLLSPFFCFSQLTGYWQTENGGCYQIRQEGNEVWWTGESTDGQRATNIFHGAVSGNMLVGIWYDMPSNLHEAWGESISLRIENNGKLVKVNSSAPYNGTVWTKVNSPCGNSGIVNTNNSSNTGKSNILTSGKNGFLNAGEYLSSPNGECYLIIQKDGNLVLYRGSGPTNTKEVIWNSKKFRGTEGAFFLAMQEDGNLVVYQGTPEKNQYSNFAIWNSETYRTKGNYFLAVKDDGTIAIYSGTGPDDPSKNQIWSKPTK